MKIKGLIAAVFLLLFAFPAAVQSVHAYHLAFCSGHEQEQHHCDDCPVCHFTLSTFEKTVFLQHTPVTSTAVPVALTGCEKIKSIPFFSYALRAPPCV